MRSNAHRFYVASITLLVFFVLWATVAAKPWAARSAAAKPKLDPRLAALNRRERRLRHEAQVVNRTLERRWREYRRRLKVREARIHALQRAHAQRVAAARAAAARAASAATAATYSTAYTPTATAATGSRVVTLPPTVKVVTLPPAASASTSSGSSHP